MTQNQIAYWNFVEQGRANRAREAQQYREHLETKRSNKAKEGETNRHNLATEQNDMDKIRVQKDYNRDYLQQSYKLAQLSNKLTKEANSIRREANAIDRERILANERVETEKMAYSNLWNEAEYQYRAEALAQQNDIQTRAQLTNLEQSRIAAASQRYSADVNREVGLERNAIEKQLGEVQANISKYQAYANAENTATRNRNDFVLGLNSNEIKSREADIHQLQANTAIAKQITDFIGKAIVTSSMGG